jgi:Protein of unknown function (DUF4232)
MRALLPAAVVAVAVLAGCGGGGGTITVTLTKTVTHSRTVTQPTATATTTASGSPCLASSLAGAFAAVPGSAGAGQIVYRLRLTNQGDSECFLTGLPQVQLLDQSGGRVPTNVTPNHPGATTAVRVDLTPGSAATADARFSPDVPGATEGNTGQCEPKAYTMRVTVGSGSVDAPITPATPVCERGTLQFDVFVAAS